MKKNLSVFVGVVLTTIVTVLVFMLAGHSNVQSQENACKTAMQQDYSYALTHPNSKPASEPETCKGLSDVVLTRLAGQVLSGQ